jgi:transmembrane sensor
MSAVDEEDVLDRAIAWRVRLRDGSEADWIAFTSWLEEAPSHATAYDAVAEADDAFDTQPVPLPLAASNDRGVTSAPAYTARPRRWLAPFAAIAAILLVALFAWPMLNRGGGDAIVTAPGETRNVTLADGTQIALNGATRLKLDSANPRFANLETGEAAFTVVHDPAHPFTVKVGSETLRDLGTMFNVVRDGARIDVAVAQGAVLYEPDGVGIRLAAGRGLSRADAQSPVLLRDLDADMVGGWRNGRLAYRGAPLGVVAADLARTTGLTVEVDPALAQRFFTGVIRVDSDRDALARTLTGVLDVHVARQGSRWQLTDGGRG